MGISVTSSTQFRNKKIMKVFINLLIISGSLAGPTGVPERDLMCPTECADLEQFGSILERGPRPDFDAECDVSILEKKCNGLESDTEVLECPKLCSGACKEIHTRWRIFGWETGGQPNGKFRRPRTTKPTTILKGNNCTLTVNLFTIKKGNKLMILTMKNNYLIFYFLPLYRPVC